MSREEFAIRLTRLHAAAGSPPSKSVVRRVNLRSSPGTRAFSGQRLSDWRLGRNIPARFDSVLPLLSVLIDEAKARPTSGRADRRLYDLNEWHGAWSRARDTAPAPNPDRPPYRGTEPYGPRDAEIFFGRRAISADLEHLVESVRGGGGPRLVLLLGAAGSGKSSVLGAGLRAGAAEKRSVAVALESDPESALADAVAALGELDGEATLLIVDQAERLFTHCPDKVVRQRFLADLERLATDPDRPRMVVVLAFRSEQRADLDAYPVLAEALPDRSLTLGALTETELRQVILRPAAKLGWRVEATLAEVMLRDIGTLGLGTEAAVLRVLTPVLTAVWEQRSGITSTLDAYRALGGLGQRLVADAERSWESLTEYEHLVAQPILLSLAIPGPRSANRDRLPRRILLEESPHPATADIVIDRLTAAGVLSAVGDAVELCNDALLTDWPRLADWLADEREPTSSRRRIWEDARVWAANERPKRLLYDGKLLREAVELCPRDASRNRTVDEFLREAQRRRFRRLLSLGTATVVTFLVLLALLSH